MISRRERSRTSRARRGGGRQLPLVVLLGLALTAAATVGASAMAGAGAQPDAQTARFSQKKAIWGPLTHNGRSLFPTYKALGVGIYQTSAHWDQIAPTVKPANPTDPNDPAYLWPDYLQQAVTEAQANGMKVQIMIIGAPPWSNGGGSRSSPPQNPQDFADFATAIAKKYPTVNLWMIWGEPNRKPNFSPVVPVVKPKGPLNAAQQVAPRVYSQLVDAAFGALKAVSPANLVIGGNTYTAAGRDDINTYQWIQYMRLPNGSRPRMDLWGHNPYGFKKPNLKDPPSPRGTVTFSDLGRLIKALDKAFPGQRLKLYLSEWGVPIGFKDKDLLYTLKVKEALTWIRAACRITRKNPRIFALGWVHPLDTSRSSQGLLTKAGKRKPSFKAFKAC